MVSSLGNSQQRGVSLIGVLIAMLILITGVMVSAQLVARTRGLSELSQQKFVATNLAREGLELVQAKRDDNWFARQPWQTDLCTNKNFIIEPDPNIGIYIHAANQAQLLYRSSQGSWTHTKTGDVTPYSRLITVEPFVWQGDQTDIDKNVDCNSETVNGLEVTSTVSWQWRGQPQQLVLKERLYNWYVTQ